MNPQTETDSAKYVILGGGMVAGYAAKELVKLGLKPGELTIVSADEELPYERPPLSKGFLAGKDTRESILINDAAFYEKNAIRLALRTSITAVDLKGRVLLSSSGEKFPFQKLLLATGCHARKLDLPGGNLPGILYLRSMADSSHIRAAANSARRALVIGAGFIGMEVASVLAQKNIETTMIFPEDRVWARVFTPAMSSFFERYYAERGVRLVKQASLKSFRGDSALRAIVSADDREFPCDLAVAGAGAIPALEPFAKSGVALDGGVVVNDYLEASSPDVWAAGDIASYPDSIFDKRRRVEHWDNAVAQGQHWAQLMLGDRKPFRHVPYFFSDVFDLSYELWGDAAGSDQVVVRGDVNSPSFSVWWLRGRRLVAAFAMNRSEDERKVASEWIEARQVVSPDLLANENRNVQEAAVV